MYENNDCCAPIPTNPGIGGRIHALLEQTCELNRLLKNEYTNLKGETAPEDKLPEPKCLNDAVQMLGKTVEDCIAVQRAIMEALF